MQFTGRHGIEAGERSLTLLRDRRIGQSRPRPASVRGQPSGRGCQSYRARLDIGDVAAWGSPPWASVTSTSPSKLYGQLGSRTNAICDPSGAKMGTDS